MPLFKEMLAAGETLRVFSLAKLPHPLVIEMFALAGGYHGFWLDLEHAFVSTEQIMMAALAARANSFDCFVRLPPSGYWQVTQCLEAGASGVMAAQIRTATQAEEFVSWCKFAPTGTRGLNVGGRDANYTHMLPAEFVRVANERVFVAIQIETAPSVDQADDIAALAGVDLLFIGPADLSLALGVPGQFQHATLWAAIERVAEACRRSGKAWGCVAPDAAFADRAASLGCRMLTLGNELIVMRRGVETQRQIYGSQFGARAEHQAPLAALRHLLPKRPRRRLEVRQSLSLRPLAACFAWLRPISRIRSAFSPAAGTFAPLRKWWSPAPSAAACST